MKRLIIIIAIFALNHTFAQFKLESWRANSSMLMVQATAVDKYDNIWAATSGGVFQYNTISEEIIEYRNIGELISINITTIAYDESSDKIYAGSSDGTINIYDFDEWSYNTDIFSSSQISNKRINDFKIDGDVAYLGGGFGFAVYDLKNNIFILDLQRIGSFNQTIVNEIVFDDDSIWVATNQGIGVASKDAFLSNPASWTTYNKDSGFLNDDITGILKIDTDVYALDEAAIYKIAGDTVEVIRTGLFNGIEEYKGDLIYVGYASLTNLFTNKNIHEYDIRMRGVQYIGDDTFLVYTNNEGLLYINDESAFLIKPDCPVTNSFVDIAFQTNGNLWFGTGDHRSGKGVMMYDGISWHNFSKNEREDMDSDGFRRVLVNQQDRVFASGWGPGFIEILKIDTGYRVITYDTSNTGLIGQSGEGRGFLAMGDIEEDRFGNVWVVSHAEQGTQGPFIGLLDTRENKSYVFDNPYSETLRNFFALTIDRNNTKWLGGYNGIGSGLLYFNDNGTYEDKSDDVFGLINSSSEPELLSNDQNAIETDMNGLLWIGTPNGLTVLLNPEGVIFGSNLILRRINLLGSNFVNDIFIDKLNNKWVATNEGVWVLNSDGSEVLANIHKNNSPLPDNVVMSVAVNPLDGRAYFGTHSGLYSAVSLSAEPLDNYEIYAYPQPFDPSKDENMIIDGLSENSIIKIVTTSGEFINEIRSAGRKAIWDGRDKNGNFVANGVYLIIAQSVSNDKSGVAKIAIIRK